MKALAATALILFLPGACREAPDRTQLPRAASPPTAEAVMAACSQAAHDRAEAMRRSVGRLEPIFEHVEIRAVSCALVATNLASCEFETALAPDFVDADPARLDWKPVRGRFRYLGTRIAHSRWYPEDVAACEGRGG